MVYKFDFEWGESWIVFESDFEWDSRYWFKVLGRHIQFFREKVKAVKQLEVITVCYIYRGEDYIGTVSVSDNYLHIVVHVPEIQDSMRLDEI